jgi:uncharacterized membrane protein
MPVNEHEKATKAAQEVQKITGFYIHLGVFVFVIASLSVVNWLTTPEMWWAQWPFVGWGIAVLGHALCAFGAMPRYISKWQVRKIKELSDQPDPSRGGTISTTIGIIVLAILIGCAAGGGYVYVQLQDALEKVTVANASREKLSETIKTQEAQLKEAQAANSSLDTAVKEAREQLRQLQVSRQDAEQTLKDQLAQAEAARDAAEKALAEAKKATPQ